MRPALLIWMTHSSTIFCCSTRLVDRPSGGPSSTSKKPPLHIVWPSSSTFCIRTGSLPVGLVCQHDMSALDAPSLLRRCRAANREAFTKLANLLRPPFVHGAEHAVQCNVQVCLAAADAVGATVDAPGADQGSTSWRLWLAAGFGARQARSPTVEPPRKQGSIAGLHLQKFAPFISSRVLVIRK